MSNFSAIIKEIERAESIVILNHVNMDGDAVGSAFALMASLKKIGKKAAVILEEKPPLYLVPFCDEYNLTSKKKFDLAIAVDCGDILRMGKRQDIFNNAKRTVCIDHHVSNQGFADVNYIKASASSTSEIVFELINEIDPDITKRQAEQLYAGIITDTGGFKFSNTTPESFIYSAKLLEKGADIAKVCIDIYETESLAKLKLKSRALDSMRLHARGKISSVIITKKDFEETGAEPSDCEGFSELGRQVAGVEAAFSITCDKKVKVSLRSKNYVDVSKVAAHFGGGGHVRASGFTLPYGTNVDKLSKDLVSMLKEEINEWRNRNKKR